VPATVAQLTFIALTPGPQLTVAVQRDCVATAARNLGHADIGDGDQHSRDSDEVIGLEAQLPVCIGAPTVHVPIDVEPSAVRRAARDATHSDTIREGNRARHRGISVSRATQLHLLVSTKRQSAESGAGAAGW
jgi:hypothetical protein